MKELVAVFHVKTRWNSWQTCIERAKVNLPAYSAMNPEAMFATDDEGDEWNAQVQRVSDSMHAVNKVLPLMERVAQWTQILSSKTTVTYSLVRAAIRSYRKLVDDLEDVAKALARGNVNDKKIAPIVKAFYESALVQVNKYYGDNNYNFELYRLAEFLDCRTIWSFDDEEAVSDAAALLNAYAYDCEKRVVRIPAAERRGSALGARVAGIGNTKSPLEAEIDDYCSLVFSMGEEACMRINPLQFWADNMHRFPILARIAARILSAQATSSEVERLFSAAGRVLTAARSRLSYDHLNEIVCLHYWLMSDMKSDPSARELKRARVAAKYATLSLELEIVPGDDSSDDDDEEEVY
jgi:hypothetical protein